MRDGRCWSLGLGWVDEECGGFALIGLCWNGGGRIRRRGEKREGLWMRRRRKRKRKRKRRDCGSGAGVGAMVSGVSDFINY